MAGEMNYINPDTGEDDAGQVWHLHLAIAKQLGGTLKPFDQYQGPYVEIPTPEGLAKLWVVSEDDGRSCRVVRRLPWHCDDTQSDLFPVWNEDAEDNAVAAARQVLRQYEVVVASVDYITEAGFWITTFQGIKNPQDFEEEPTQLGDTEESSSEEEACEQAEAALRSILSRHYADRVVMLVNGDERLCLPDGTSSPAEGKPMHTVNVIELDCNGLVNSLASFPDNDAGNKLAEELFRRLVGETTDLPEEAVSDALDDGFAGVLGGGSIQLVHSTRVE